MYSSQEMYERGIIDAEQNNLNIFYYQHYYYYRKGYDRARRHIKHQSTPGSPIHKRTTLLVISLMIVAAIAGAVVFLFPDALASISSISGAGQAPTTAATEPLPRTPTAQPSSTPTVQATDTPVPEPELVAGGQARVVNVGEAALLARQAPATEAPVQSRLDEGTLVQILEGPVEAEGYTWWLIQDDAANGGWSAQSSQDGVEWLQPYQE
jgi:hypothetical protein